MAPKYIYSGEKKEVRKAVREDWPDKIIVIDGSEKYKGKQTDLLRNM